MHTMDFSSRRLSPTQPGALPRFIVTRTGAWLKPVRGIRILNRMGRRLRTQLFLAKEPVVTAVKVLGDKQKRSLLEEVKDDVSGRRLVRLVVGGDLKLYKHLIEVKKGNNLVLSPLKGLPDEVKFCRRNL